MRAENKSPLSPHVLRALAGLETGILGGLAMGAWVLLASAASGRPVWAVPNVIASLILGRSALQRTFGWPSICGLALHLFAAGLIGLVFGYIVGGTRSRIRIALLGILTGLLWHYFSQALLWNKIGVLSALYSSPRAFLVGHLLYGAVLALFPSRLWKLAVRFHEEPVPAAAGLPGDPGISG